MAVEYRFRSSISAAAGDTESPKNSKASLMIRLKRSEILIAGPWLNELGWEIMTWQAAVRFLRVSKKYQKTYVITFKNREALYEDCELFEHDEKLVNAIFGIGGASRQKTKELVQACVDHFGIKDGFDVFTPDDYLSIRSKIMRRFRSDMMFKKFYIAPKDDERFDVAFHFRDFVRQGDTLQKAFSPRKADSLVERCLSDKLKVCCIGAPGYSYVAEAAENRQSNDLSSTISTMCASRLVVGGSSAPMHLASHCGIPIVVWISSPPGATRFFTFGNPFNSKVFLVTEETFNPEVDDIFSEIGMALSHI